ncbi:hypothetical protein KQ246_06725 [Pseudoalteromonas shioyasakiensis]|nr:hypothetical protein KQ246_06725 [Pseudoalteromonas shioyasakiensis]
MVNSKIIWEGNSNIEDFKIVTCKSCLRLFSCEETLKDYWQEVLEEAKNAGTEIWDGQYYRLENIDEIQRGSLQLKLSTIPYSTIRSLIKLGQQQKPGELLLSIPYKYRGVNIDK